MGLATGVMVWGVYDRSLPDAATMGATDAMDVHIESGRKKAAWTAAAVVGAVTLLTRDRNVFILGGGVLVLLDLHARHANAVNADTGKLDLTAAAYANKTAGKYGAKLAAVS